MPLSDSTLASPKALIGALIGFFALAALLFFVAKDAETIESRLKNQGENQGENHGENQARSELLGQSGQAANDKEDRGGHWAKYETIVAGGLVITSSSPWPAQGSPWASPWASPWVSPWVSYGGSSFAALVSWPGQALLEAPPVKEIKNDSPVKPPSKKTPSAQAKKAQPGPAHKGPVKAGLERGGKKSKPRLPPGGEPGPSPVTVECLADSAKRFELPMSLLVLVLAVESGRVGEVSKNANGTYDMGPMQINSFWLPLLTKMGLSEKTVTDNGCVNLAVGAWILRSHLKRSKSLPQALSDYHSLNPERGKKYLRAAKRKLKNLDLAKTLEWVNQSLAEGDRPVLPKPAPIGELDGQTLKL